jgi:NAD(P)-dependent dehydrogenase (short-subunit alcohol dehydrogenase family)
VPPRGAGRRAGGYHYCRISRNSQRQGALSKNATESQRHVGEITEESFHLHYNINVLGAILTVQEAVKRFGADGGSIISLSSIVGSHPVAGVLLYALSFIRKDA